MTSHGDPAYGEPGDHDLPAAADRPLAGRTVVLVHPAWHSCGSHQVFVSQARAYRSLGARVVAVALEDVPARAGGRQHRDYLARTADLVADQRLWTAMPPRATLSPRFAAALLRRARGDQATLRVAVAERIAAPAALGASPRADLVHCNHFFCMPFATKVARAAGAPLLLDSHDVQARQYRLAAEAAPTLPPRVSFEDMLAVELRWMREADVLLHLNSDEARVFAERLPGRRHALLYPAVTPVEAEPGGRSILVVAAANLPNVESVLWLLRAVAPQVPNLRFHVVGSVVGEVRRREPGLCSAANAVFTERVGAIAEAYAGAAVVALPTVAGHGISIKTIEALSSGLPLVATPHAFRGMDLDARRLGNVAVASDAAGFASALRRMASPGGHRGAPGSPPDTRLAYRRLFSPEAYRGSLAAIVAEVF